MSRPRPPSSRRTKTCTPTAYVFPNDPPELDRLDDQYELVKEMMDGQLHLAPFTQENPPTKILDIGTGTGLWAVEMGDEYPSAHIIGTDLSPVQPALVPPNVRFFVEDSYAHPLP